jgi:peroxiredoxin
MTNRVRGVLVLGTGLALASISVGCSHESGSDRADAPLEVGQAAPAYAAKSVAGDAVSLAGLRGKVVLLNAWATWCVPCRVEIPLIRALNATYARQGLQVVGVSLDESDSATAIRAFVKQYDMKYSIWRDPAQRFSTDFRFEGLPMTVLVDRAGVVRWIWRGRLEPRDTTLDEAIRNALVTSR